MTHDIRSKEEAGLSKIEESRDILGFNLYEIIGQFIREQAYDLAQATVVGKVRALCQLCSHVNEHSSQRNAKITFDDLTGAAITRYLADREREGQTARASKSHLRTFFEWLAARGQCDRSVLLGIDSYRHRDAQRASQVHSRSGTSGPLPVEDEEKIRHALAEGVGGIQGRTATMLCLETGLRPSSAAALKCSNLAWSEAGGYVLRVPLLKRRQVASYVRCPISNVLARLLQEGSEKGGPGDPLLPWAHAYARPNDRVGAVVTRWVEALDAKTITGAKLRATPRQFRKTLATNMLRDGMDEQAIAAHLGHVDLSTLECYVRPRPDIAEAVSEALDPHLWPLVRLARPEMNGPKGCSMTQFDAWEITLEKKFSSDLPPFDSASSASMYGAYERRKSEGVNKFTPLQRDSALKELLREARSLHEAKWPKSCDFDNDTWPLDHLRRRTNNGRLKKITFLKSDGESVPEPITIVRKILFVFWSPNAALRAGRALAIAWEVWGEEMESFAWERLRPHSLGHVAERLEESVRHGELSGRYAGDILLALHRTLEWLGRHGVIDVSGGFKADRRTVRRRFRALSPQKPSRPLPPRQVVEALLKIYASRTKADGNRLLACAAALLIMLPLRIGEITTLPRDCLVRERLRSGGWGVGLKYFPEKGSHALGLYSAVLWLTPAQRALVEPIVEEVKVLTCEARSRASDLEAFARETVGSIEKPLERFPLDCSRAFLSRAVVADLLSIKKSSVRNYVRSGALPRRGSVETPFCARDVERFLLDRMEPLWTIRLADGVMPLSQNLFTIYRRQFSSRSGPDSTLVAPLKDSTVRDFLQHPRGDKNPYSFHRLVPDLVPTGKEEDFCTSPHSFRRLISTAGHLGGLPLKKLACWVNAVGGAEGRLPYIRESCAQQRRSILSASGEILEDPWGNGQRAGVSRADEY